MSGFSTVVLYLVDNLPSQPSRRHGGMGCFHSVQRRRLACGHRLRRIHFFALPMHAPAHCRQFFDDLFSAGMTFALMDPADCAATVVGCDARPDWIWVSK